MALSITLIIMLTVLAQEVQCDVTLRDITWLESETEYRAEVLQSAKPAAVMFTTKDCWMCTLFEDPFAYIGAQLPDNPFYKLNIGSGYFSPIGNRHDFDGFPTICVYEDGQVIHGRTGMSLWCVMEALTSVPCRDATGAVVPFTPQACDAITTTA